MKDIFCIDSLDTSKNLFIEASAGTGKTYTIQQIVAKMIYEGSKLENILIVTYTDKAAGELKDRIRRKLEEVISTNMLWPGSKIVLTDEDLEKFEEELAQIDNASIYTIHGFCEKTLREFAFTVKRPFSMELIDEQEFLSYLERLIRDEFKDDKLFQDWFKNNNNSMPSFSLFAEAVGKYYTSLTGKEDERIVSLVKSDNLFLDQELTIDQWNLLASAKKPEDIFFIKKFKESFEFKTSNEKYNGLIENIKESFDSNRYKDLFNGKKFQSRYFSDEEKEHFMVFYEIKNFFKKNSISAIFEKTFIYEKLLEVYNKWQLEKEELGFQSFDDMIRIVRENVIDQDSSLRKVLKTKYKYAIIDEFQDTNQKQWDIFKSIFMSDTNHSLIVVGDPKQSIYAFQGADLTVYEKATSEIGKIGSESSLIFNYRSTEDMIKACNEIFSAKNENFEAAFFQEDEFGSNIKYSDSFAPEDEKLRKKNAKFYNKNIGYRSIPSIMLAAGKIDNEPSPLEDDSLYAEIVVKHIVDCCSFADGKTKLQFFDKNKPGELRNVSFRDFAVLCKTHFDFYYFERKFKEYGIPFSKYKDGNLFTGKECADWIALLSAIAVPDFSGRNQAVFKEALFTAFFGIPLAELDDPKYSETTNKEKNLFIEWKGFAQRREWATLIDHIFEETKVEERLSKLDKLHSLAKMRQIGNYAVEYLYNNDCSIEKLVQHFIGLTESEVAETENGNLVEKGTDFDCIQVMTIHASKGLEFPVVICAGSPFKNKTSILYHEDGKLKLGINKEGVEISSAELYREQQRLFYVAYTRAASLLILPYYQQNDFISDALNQFVKKSLNYKFIFNNTSASAKTLKQNVLDILQQSKIGEKDLDDGCEQDQQIVLKKVVKHIPTIITKSFSYSSLSHNSRIEEIELEDQTSRYDKEGEISNQNIANRIISSFDKNAIVIPVVYNQDAKSEISADYPKGKFIGNALHEIFEKSDYYEIVNLSKNGIDDSSKIKNLFIQCFEKQNLNCRGSYGEMLFEDTKKILWNTLNSILPEIKGNIFTKKCFSLGEITNKNKLTEAEFNMNNSDKQWINKFTKGFIDLMFVRDGYYSILDWKSDTLDNYSNEDSLKMHVNNHYSIQRVLYSYCLIKWLSYFYPDESEEEIFMNHFGGVYYVLVKGCVCGTGNGIYAQTWNSWNDLKLAFENIKNTLMGV